jgi:DNA-directed RNA polymerase specialized sigma subunit
MTVKEYLCRYHNILEEIKVKKQYIEFCKERESSISGPSYDFMPKSPNRDTEAPFVKWLIKRRTAEDELNELEEKARKVKEETETAISKLNDECSEMILFMRYLEWMTWEDIGSKLYCSAATIKRKHEKAISELKFT